MQLLFTAGQSPHGLQCSLPFPIRNLLLQTGTLPTCVLSFLVRSCHGVTSPKVIHHAAGHSIFKVPVC